MLISLLVLALIVILVATLAGGAINLATSGPIGLILVIVLLVLLFNN